MALSDLISLGAPNFIGVDIGLSAVRICELSHVKKNEYKLIKFSSMDLPEGAFLEDEINKRDEIVTAFKRALKSLGSANKNACIGLSGPNTIARRLNLAGGTEEEIEDQVMWESEQYIPFGIDDSTVSFHIIGANEGGGSDVMMAAVRNDILESFKEIATEVGLKVKCVDLSLFAQINIFEHVKSKILQTDTCIFIDVGAQKLSLAICKQRGMVFNKEISLGGIIFTEEIQRQMGINYVEAEDLKINGAENGKLPQEILEVIESELEVFFSEIKKTLNFYITATQDENINYCFLTGGTSLIPGFKEGLEGVLGIDVSYFNPFEVIGHNKSISQDHLEYIASCGCIAMGLAMRGSKE